MNTASWLVSVTSKPSIGVLSAYWNVTSIVLPSGEDEVKKWEINTENVNSNTRKAAKVIAFFFLSKDSHLFILF